MEEQIIFNETPKESILKKTKRLIFSGPTYWIRGGKIGLFILFLFFSICFITAPAFVGLVALEIFTENILNPISRDITGIDLSTSTGGWFSFEIPSIFGWLYLCVVFFLAGSFIGSFFDIIKKRVIIPPIFITLFVLLFGTYLFSAHFAKAPFKCSLMFDGSSAGYYQPKSACLLNYVASNNNVTDSIICDNLNENRYNSKKSKCFSVIAKRTGDPKYCDHIPESAENRLKEQCYSSLGKEYKNISLCKSGSPEIDDKCLTSVAIGQDNHSICEQISSAKEKDNCYMSFSFKYHDLNLCEKISDAGGKERCIKFSRYDDPNIALSIPEYYTYNQESSDYKDPNCPSEVNIFLRRGHDDNGTFIGKLFACKDDVIRGNGLYLNKGQKSLSLIGNKIIGKYDFKIYQDDSSTRRIYLTRPNSISISAIIDYSYYNSSIPQNVISDFENFISKIYIKDSLNEKNINQGNWQMSDSYKISQNQSSYANAENTSDSFNGGIDDENIKLQYDMTLFNIIRNKGHENEVWVGNYEIYPKNDSTLPVGFNEAEIFIEKKTYIRDLDKLENDQNQIMQSNGSTITRVQRIKLGNYEYVKTISKDRIDYVTSLGKIQVSALLDFRYLPQTDENIKKIENLITNIQYKF